MTTERYVDEIAPKHQVNAEKERQAFCNSEKARAAALELQRCLACVRHDDEDNE